MSENGRPEINMSRIKVSGVGGLGLVAIAGVMAYVLPEARWFVFASLIGGGVLGVAYAAYHRWIRPQPPHGPTLMVDPSTQTDPTPERHRENSIKLGTAIKHV